MEYKRRDVIMKFIEVCNFRTGPRLFNTKDQANMELWLSYEAVLTFRC
jgi:hypothetical protein